MATCVRCRRTVRFWQVGLFRSSCALCQRDDRSARDQLRQQQTHARHTAFEQYGPTRRMWIGASRGMVFGSIMLVVVGLSVVGLLAGAGSSYPFGNVSLLWFVLTLLAVAVAGIVGWWLASWFIGIGCLVAIGALGGAIVGGHQGLRGTLIA